MHHRLAEDALVNQSGGNISGVRVSLFCHYDLDLKGDRGWVVLQHKNVVQYKKARLELITEFTSSQMKEDIKHFSTSSCSCGRDGNTTQTVQLC